MDEEIVGHMFQEQTETIVAKPLFGFDPFAVSLNVASTQEQPSHIVLDLVPKTDEQVLIGGREPGLAFLLNHQRAEDLALRPMDRRAEEGLPCRNVYHDPRLSIIPAGNVGHLRTGIAYNRLAEVLQCGQALHRVGTRGIRVSSAGNDDLAALAAPSCDKCDCILQKPGKGIGGGGPSLDDGRRNSRLDLAFAIRLQVAASHLRRHACFPLKRAA
ncbi:hypothetical protein [Labrys sp. KNU-23]|uniref:hypothetical protein n=1 Tax=Labrys sp. KNU-23 TaxID=2789216 RepID=UPI001AEEB4BB|nr:hypothetical protein [Labrys sp. KNU-23]